MATKTVVKIKWNHFGIYRRFQIPLTDDCDIYKELLNKIRAVVPDFAGRLGWKDEEGDIIYFSSNEELLDALPFCKDYLLRIHTVENVPESKNTIMENAERKRSTSFEKEVHPYVTCDRCDQPVYGIRYKCGVCDDYDLCEECEKEGAHPDHAMIRYATPRTPLLRLDAGRARRHWQRHPRGHRNPFMQEGLFGYTATAAQQAASAAAQHAAHHAAAAAQQAAQHAAAAAAQFTQNVNGANDSADERPQQFRDSVAQGMEYLKEVGSQIQQALANFGIEVDMDVQHGGVTEKVPKANPPSTEKNESTTGDANEQDKASVPNDVGDSKIDDGKRKNNDANVQGMKDLMNPDVLDVPLKKMHISESEQERSDEQNVKEVASGADDNISEDWTMMEDMGIPANKNGASDGGAPMYPVLVDNGGKCMAGTPFIFPAPGPHDPHCHFIFPDQQVALCVEQLEAMGFDNCNGWLTKLAVDLKGDVGAVIEDLKKDPIYAKHFESSS